ncbi:probable choline kinase 2 isoform X2 [Physcomitrium patens]|uniref:Choline kinase N-terminal domain-containing protein n=1 Tax=Physcomitrium patens TaxID=3218 RepID=A0A7I4CRC9_PHYPA|nr:probable choline kinase 2 isoform X2 [Physcomitrium patens]|eukprot:XP_024365805.1 probable choline kinase 2 isoform X2 [Physcomitrella patens]
MVLVDTVSQSSFHTTTKPCTVESWLTGTEPAENDTADASLVKQTSIELPVEAYKELHKLAGKWMDILDPKDLTLTRLKGAMTNHVYQCHWERDNGHPPRKVLVRVYGEGSSMFFDRNDEVMTFERMSLKDQGPHLLGRFPNGRVEEFLRARTLTKQDLRDPEISKKIAVKLQEFHKLDIPGPRKAKLWERLRDWLVKILEHPDTSDEDFGLNKLDDEINDLQRRLMKPDTRIGFCHNDLQYGNIMVSEKDDSVTLIDYEYASYNPVAFDIANHFCEMTADYHSDEPHLLNQESFPDYEERSQFCRAYLEASVSQEDVRKLIKEVDEFVLASHLHWALWGLLSAAHQDVEFDFLRYSQQRFSEYFKLKRELFGSR